MRQFVFDLRPLTKEDLESDSSSLVVAGYAGGLESVLADYVGKEVKVTFSEIRRRNPRFHLKA